MDWLLWLAGFVVVLFGFVVFFGAPYVPSKRRDVELAFSELYPLSKRDILLDLGSGDGSVLRAAARRGARAIGFELNPLLVLLSRLLGRRFSRLETHVANMWQTPFPSRVTVVYVFGVSRDADRLGRKLQTEAIRLGRTLTVICYGTVLLGMIPVRQVGAHYLYEFHPLQSKKT